MTPKLHCAAAFAGLGFLFACTSTHEDADYRGYSSASGDPSATTQTSESRGATARPASTRRGTKAPAGMTRMALAYPTGSEDTSAIMLEKLAPAEAAVGQEFDYQIVVTNLTGAAIDGVEVVDKLSPDFMVVSSTPKATNMNAGQVTWGLGSLAPNASETIRVTGKAAKQGSVGSCASVSYNQALCASIAVVQPMLSLEMASIGEALICDEIPMEFVVRNAGSGTTHDVNVQAELPEGLMTKDGKRTVSLRVDELGPGASKKFMVKAEAQRPGRFETRATASAGGGLKAEPVMKAIVVREPKLELTAKAPQKSYIGTVSTYEFTVKNTGDAVAQEAVVVADLGSAMEFVSATDGGKVASGKVRWSLGSMQPGATKMLSTNLRSKGAATLRGTANAMAHCAKTAAATYQSELVGIPAILIEVIDIEDPIRVGGEEVYEIKITNQGSAPDTNIKIVCELDAGMQFVSGVGPTTASAAGNRVTMGALASLAAKKEATWRLTIKGNQAGDMRFKVIMTSDELTRPVEETEATKFYE